MSFGVWILLMNLRIGEFCNAFIHPEPTCFEYIQDCALDGEDLEWCKDDYMKNGKVARIEIMEQ